MGKTPKSAYFRGQKQNIEKEIAILQDSCNHPTKSIKLVRERLDSITMVIRYVCDNCYLPIGYPNNEEINKFLRK